ncbi:MAG: hypothetical protein IJY90_03420 [Clostridia bacterium]|nr:hypothetical protein [Clostridia bacterium]
MDKQEILKKAQSKKAVVGEMEQRKIDKSNWIAVIVAGIFAVAFIIVFGALGLRECIWAIAAICFIWASVFYFCQYFLAKRPAGVLIGAVLEGLGACIMIANFILDLTGVI